MVNWKEVKLSTYMALDIYLHRLSGSKLEVSPIKIKKPDVSIASPSSERIKEMWFVCGLYIE